jgi:radical SAM-linked protein
MAIRFVVTGDLRFLSHRDMVRLWARAIARANLSICYSAGFNPRPRVWLLLPRSVGVASDDELLIMELDRPQPPAQVLEQLARQTPSGIVLREAFELARHSRPRPVEATYRLDLNDESVDPALPGAHLDAEQVSRLAERARQVAAAQCLEVQRTSPKDGRTRTVDVRKYVRRIDLADMALDIVLQISPAGSARPSEVLEVLGLDPVEMLPRLRRVSVRWAGIEAEPAGSPGSESLARPQEHPSGPVKDAPWDGNEK